jgi:hypothetical protein
VETTEFQPGVDDVGWRRRAGGSVSVRMPTLTMEQQEQQAAQKLTEAAFLYAQCIQLLLQVRCRMAACSQFMVENTSAGMYCLPLYETCHSSTMLPCSR